MKVTYFFIPIVTVAVVLLLLRDEERHPFLAAAALLHGWFLVPLIFCFFAIAYLLLRGKGVIRLGNLFLLLAIFVSLSGMLLYTGMRLLHDFIKFSKMVLSMVEYYIQWSLIYVTGNFR